MATPDRFDLYERCAQAPDRDVRLLQAIHGESPRILGEDFSGTAALSRAWVGLIESGRAVAVDRDPEPLRRASGVPRVRTLCADVRSARSRADLIAVLNFSIGELHDRADLVRYLAHARSRLTPRGVLICDMYGGDDAYTTGEIIEQLRLSAGRRVEYTWEQRHADPLTGMVVNAMHFRVTQRGRPPVILRDAFIYHWRLWSVPELRDAMREAGFRQTEVYHRVEHALDERGRAHLHPLPPDGDLESAFIVLVAARR
jgi:hypothetical protein